MRLWEIVIHFAEIGLILLGYSGFWALVADLGAAFYPDGRTLLRRHRVTPSRRTGRSPPGRFRLSVPVHGGDFTSDAIRAARLVLVRLRRGRA